MGSVREFSKLERTDFAVLLLGVVFTLTLTLGFDAMDIDSSQYAEIAREMVGSKEFLFLRDNGRKYLDKPVLTFWSIAASYLVFGVNNVAFRIPALLISLLAARSLFRIAVLTSNSRRRGWIAAILYLSCPGLFAMVLDPKIDVYLTAYLIFTHHAYYLGVKQNRRWFLLMYLYIGLGFITKGPISAVIPAISIGGDILFRRDWQRLGSMYIVPGIFIAAAPPAFWSWVLYQEFSSYGPNFFLVIQSFGRFYKKMYDQKFNPIYFPANFSWAFGAFVLPLVYVCAGFVRRFFAGGMRQTFSRLLSDVRSNAFFERDFVVPFWIFVTLTLISFSRYQLPQYIYWILPAAALFSAGWVEERFFTEDGSWEPNRAINVLSLIVPGLLVLISLLMPIVSVDPALSLFLVIVPIGVGLFAIRRLPWQFAAPVAAAALLYTVVNTILYPELLKYQPAKAMAVDIQRLEPEESFVYVFGLSSSKRSYGLYARRNTKWIYDQEAFLQQVNMDKSRLVIVPETYLEYFKGAVLSHDVEMEVVARYPACKVATPSAKFLQKKKRASMAKDVLLVRVKAAVFSNPIRK